MVRRAGHRRISALVTWGGAIPGSSPGWPRPVSGARQGPVGQSAYVSPRSAFATREAGGVKRSP